MTGWLYQELFFLYSLKVKIEESRQGKEDSKCKVYGLLCPHHSSELYGDLRAMKCLVEGCSDDFDPLILLGCRILLTTKELYNVDD